jgi:hypothetical protein
MKVRKVLLWIGGILVALVLLVWLGGWGLLKSPFARNKASEELTKLLGVPVQVDELDLGGSSTTASIRIPDPGAGPNENLVRIGSLDTDITLGGLLGGNASPTYVNASDVDFLFRIDEKGNILSPLPKETPTTKPAGGGKPLPDIKVKGGTVRIRQTGKDEFAVGGLTAHLRRDGDAYVLDGDLDDPKWGKWKVSGRLTSDFADGQVSLTSERAGLHDDLLKTIPYVPREVWDHIGASGQTAAAVAFTFKPGADLGYSVDLKPQKASLTLPDAAVTLTDVQGDIRIADGAVTVPAASVALAGGTGTLAGEYRFDRPTAVISVKADASGIDMTRLPEKWELPKDITGKLKGSADLELRIAPDGTLTTLGGGDVEVEDAKIKGLESAKIDEFKLKLVGGDGGYRFKDSRAAGK